MRAINPRSQQRGAGDKETRMLRLWQTAISPVDAFYAQMAESVFRGVKWAIAERINAAGDLDQRFCSCDQGMAEYYNKLVLYYENALDIYDGNQQALSLIAAHRSGDIMKGMRAVILSRVMAMRDYGTRGDQQGYAIGAKSDAAENPAVPRKPARNPIKNEADMLISRCIRGFSDSFDVVSYRCRSELYGGCFHSTRRRFVGFVNGGAGEEQQAAAEVFADALRVVREKGFPRFYELYLETAEKTAQSLTGLYAKGAAIWYGEQLNNEHEILRNLATVQVSALERETALLPLEAKNVASSFITCILAAYQALSKDVQLLLEQFMGAAVQPAPVKPPDYESFAAALDIAAASGFKPETFGDAASGFTVKLEFMRRQFEQDMQASVTALLGLGSRAKAAESAWEAVAAMTGDIRRVFLDINEYYMGDEALQNDETQEGRISRGVAETVGIKAQSLEESQAAQEMEIRALLSDMPQEDENGVPQDFDELTATAFESLVDELVNYLKEDRRALSAIKKYLAFCASNDIYAGYLERLLRPVQKNTEAIAARLMKYKREYVLYEISTFEEIQNYSVSRLRDSTEPHIAGFVKKLDDGAARLAEILSCNGILLIRPQPRDAFNGREHEVLMAEKHEDYKKGEIIKLMNSGFKQGDTVILRANVIAAK